MPTLVATAQPTTYPPSVRLDVSGAGAYSAVVVQRMLPSGRIDPVRGLNGDRVTVVSGVASLTDFEAPYGVSVTYRLLNAAGDWVLAGGGGYVPVSFYGQNLPAGTPTYTRNADGSYTAAGASGQQLAVSQPVTLEEDRPWLVTPGRPGLSMPTDLRRGSFAETGRATSRGVLWPVGRSTPIVVSGGARRSAESTVIVQTGSDSEAELMLRILAPDAVVLLNIPASLGIGVSAQYISVGDVQEVRPSDIGTDRLRNWQLPYLVTTAPVSVVGRIAPTSPGSGGGGGDTGGGGGPVAGRTWADLALEYATWQAAADAYNLWADASAGPAA